MADFCFQCSVDLYFGPSSDFDHLAEMYKDDELRLGVLCEGCGPVEVDRHGRCRDPDCAAHGAGIAPGRSKVYESASRWVARRSGPLGRFLRLRDRLVGTPWEPGTLHYWRWRWNSWRNRNKPVAYIYHEPIQLDEANLHAAFFGEYPIDGEDTTARIVAAAEVDHGAEPSGLLGEESDGSVRRG